MIAWYRQQVKEHGAVLATKWLWRVMSSVTKTRLANRLLSAQLTCPCCGWSGRRFFDYIEVGYTMPNEACPQCDSHSRHRFFFLWLKRERRLEESSGIALVFAPEKALAPVWTAASQLKVIRVDLEPKRGTDVLADLQRLPFKTNSTALLWCHHVLEHVEDDLAAINELRRVLIPQSGQLILSVPMIPGTKTEEYGFADPLLSGHWRIYGDDLVERLSSAGLQITEVDFVLSPEDCRRYGIKPEPFYLCLKP